MAKKCPKCQFENTSDSKFCKECGTQLPSVEDIEITETMETPKEELTTGSTFAGRYQIIEESMYKNSLDMALEERESIITYVVNNPIFSKIYSDKTFADFLKKTKSTRKGISLEAKP